MQIIIIELAKYNNKYDNQHKGNKLRIYVVFGYLFAHSKFLFKSDFLIGPENVDTEKN